MSYPFCHAQTKKLMKLTTHMLHPERQDRAPSSRSARTNQPPPARQSGGKNHPSLAQLAPRGHRPARNPVRLPPINKQNLSQWKTGGFRDWLACQEALESVPRLDYGPPQPSLVKASQTESSLIQPKKRGGTPRLSAGTLFFTALALSRFVPAFPGLSRFIFTQRPKPIIPLLTPYGLLAVISTCWPLLAPKNKQSLMKYVIPLLSLLPLKKL